MSSSNDVTTPEGTSSSSVESFTGRVKWFNNKAGYGFITITDGPRSGSDVFVHHSAIGVSNQQYKYLVQGEYVEFGLTTTENSTHEFQASNVCGIKSGKLMCETRHEFKTSRANYKSARPGEDDETAEPVKMPRQVRAPREESSRPPATSRAPRVRGDGPRDSESSEWKLVDRTRSTSKPSASAAGRGRGRPPRSTTESK